MKRIGKSVASQTMLSGNENESDRVLELETPSEYWTLGLLHMFGSAEAGQLVMSSLFSQHGVTCGALKTLLQEMFEYFFFNLKTNYFMWKFANCILALHSVCPAVICSHCFSYRKEVALASELNKTPLHFSLELKSTYIWISCDLLTFLSVLTKLSPSRIKKKRTHGIFHLYQPLEHSVLFITALSIHRVFRGKRHGITAKNLLLVL